MSGAREMTGTEKMARKIWVFLLGLNEYKEKVFKRGFFCVG